MNRIFKYYKNCKGITLVLMAFMLAVLLMLAGLAIDIAYMYYVKNQLQVAADAAALAGAARLDGTNSTVQTAARAEAVTFAAKNSAAGSPVVLAPNDVIVGYWDGSSFSTGSGMITNAVQVIARRDETAVSSPRRQVRVFIGQIFKIIKADWSFMSARASAIAMMPLRANAFISVCIKACSDPFSVCAYPNVCTTSPPRVLETGPQNCTKTDQSECDKKFGWTTLLQNPTAPGFNLEALVCGSAPYQDVCDKQIYTTMGQTSVVKDLESVFYDPTTPKTTCPPISGYSCTEVPGDVGWWVIIPITEDCPPGGQGGWDPHNVSGYALLRIVAVCASGGSGCRGYDVCDTWPNPSPPPPNVSNVIVIDRISCISCPAADLMIGLRPILVK